MQSRLVQFSIFTMLVLIGLELFVRANGKYFDALSDKMLLKVKILERDPDTKVLFLGTSRFLDAIDHQLFTKELKSRTGHTFKSLNAATAGLQNERLAEFARIAARNKGLTHVIIEASPPAMGRGASTDPVEAPEINEAEVEKRFADRVEDRLQAFLVDKIAMITYRKALRPKTMIELFVLYTSDMMDPNIWSRKRPLEAIFLPANVPVDDRMLEQYRPEVVLPNEETAGPPEGIQFANLQKIADVFAGSDIEVIWLAPPVSKQQIKGNHNAKYTKYYQSIANRRGNLFYDYAGIGMEDQFLRDPSHLNGKGRNAFTKILAAHLAHHFSSENPVP